MAGGLPSIKEKMGLSVDKELKPGGQKQSQEHLMVAEMAERGTWSLGASQRRQKLETKAPCSVLAPPDWNMSASHPKKMRPQLQKPRMSREQGQNDTHENPGGFQDVRHQYDSNPESDVVAEIGLEELNELEMEIMRRQLRVITWRLQALEDQGATWRHREALFFAMLVSACIANLWLWIRQ
ncbi:fetal and adult testis-expressed transcript protein [Dasypus novemcinctus]|uniref:fetal and adult testis-expressed transcript protein n=1 Tax=Dasypus novemcinctus TaxID=9361 RepID=UPI00265DE1FC|nr:fetal and adult testis-expressed transcript protein [Dasypus novemcinctus]